MAEEHLSTMPVEQKEPVGRREIKPQDFSSEIASELDQLISLSELLLKLEDAGPGEMRSGTFYGIGGIITGGADRIKSMLDRHDKYMYEMGRTKGFEEFSRALNTPPKETLFKIPEVNPGPGPAGTLHYLLPFEGLLEYLQSLKKITDRFILLGQGTEMDPIDPQEVVEFGKYIRTWRLSFEGFFQQCPRQSPE